MIDASFDEYVTRAVRGLLRAREHLGKELPIELFYALYNFTAFDSLAIEIEEALIPPGRRPDGRVTTRRDRIRRRDLAADEDPAGPGGV